MNLTIALLIAGVALSLIAVVLASLLLWQRKRTARTDAEASQRLDALLKQLEKKLNGADVLRVDHLKSIEAALQSLREEIAAVSDRAGAPITGTSLPPATDRVALERQILGESWRKFCANRELSSAFDSALQNRGWGMLLDQLTNAVPVDLKATFESVVNPYREHRMLLQKIELIPKLVSESFPRLETDAEEINRTRELASLLTPDAANRLEFRFKSWVTDTFLPFADLYLQRYQQAEPDQRNGELQTGVNLVRQVLRIAAVEPIDVTPGETPFDSTRHIGRSTTNDPRYSDGVITGVVRNGFIEGGQQVIRQPEVIVNRMR